MREWRKKRRDCEKVSSATRYVILTCRYQALPLALIDRYFNGYKRIKFKFI